MSRLLDKVRVPIADSVLNTFIKHCIGNKSDAAAAGTVTSTDSLMAYIKQLVTAEFALPKCVVKTDGAILAAVDPLFTITGGPVRAKIVGLVTTLVVGASNLRLQHITTAPAATVQLNAGAVAVNDDAVGTFYYNVGVTGVFTPSTGLGFKIQDPVTVEEVDYLLAPGVVQCLGSTARAGVIAWYMSYVPLSPLSRVVVAA